MNAKLLVVSFSLLAFAGAPAYATEAKQPTQRQADMPWDRSASLKQGEFLASDLRGMQVTNAKGEDIGDISDIVIDLNSGKVHAAVLEFGGFLGIGDKNFAFPVTELKPGKERNQVVINVDKKALESREGFAKGQWPGMSDDYWGRLGGKQAAAGAGGGDKQKMNLVRASELVGKDVQDKSGQNVGQVRDVVIGLEQGQVNNVVVAVRDGGQASVPAKAIKASGTDNRLVLDMSAEQLRPSDRPLQRPAQPSR